MKQVFFDGKGKLLLKDVPAPTVPDKGVLVQVHKSLISSGTETSQAVGGGSLIRKAMAQPELIGRAIQLAMREGLKFTAGAVQDISDSWFPAGYSAAGLIIEAGPQVSGLRAGDRVACAGAGFANHAEYDAVPINLTARIPDGVSYRQAAFTTLGAIALQGVRRAEVTLGETVVVVGLGLIGQITAQLLDAAGCRVIGSDPVAQRRDLAAQLTGTQAIDPSLGDVVQQVMELTDGVGADKVILCAATHSSDPTNQAFKMCRERGRVVMVGAMGMDLERTDFYNRELDFVISRSVGPGRYDRDYEERGVDYPIGYVRWTEQRNMAAVLQLMVDGKLDVESLITDEFPIEQADEAYQVVQEGSLATLLTYGAAETIDTVLPDRTLIRAAETKSGRLGIGLIGAGSFARATHLPNIKNSPFFDLRAVVSDSATATQAAQKYKAALATTDLEAALSDLGVDAVLIATRHHLHAAQSIAAMQAGKHVYVEKPMAITLPDAEAMVQIARETGRLLTIGLNRRAAPTAQALKTALDQVNSPMTITFRVNAGAIPANHWLNDPLEGGGRMLGEGVHFVDFICGMVNAEPLMVSAQASADGQNFILTIQFADGSLGAVVYTAQGDPTFPKEQVEVFCGGGVAVLEDFKTLTFKGMPGKAIKASGDKGHRALLDNFGAAIQGEADLIVTAEDGYRANLIALAAAASVQIGRTIDLRTWPPSEGEESEV